MWVKILCHVNFVRLVTADHGGSMMGAIMLFLTEKFHLEPFFFINSFTTTSFKINNAP